MFYYEDLCSSCIFKTLNNQFKLQTIHENLGREACKDLLGFHSFSGCDQTSKFNGYSKLSCCELFQSSNGSILEAFQELGKNLSPSTYDGLENFVMDLYCPKLPLTISNIGGELRWYMFSKFHYESEKLTPTKSTLCEKIPRSHYTSSVWKSVHLPSPVLTDPKEFGWRWNSSEKSYESIMTKKLPALETVIELCICKCKTGCTSLRCMLKKTACYVQKCVCVNCCNDENDNDNVDSDVHIDEE